MSKVFVDTNILVYSMDKHDLLKMSKKKRGRCVGMLECCPPHTCPLTYGKMKLDLDFMGIWVFLVMLDNPGSDTLLF